MSWTYARCDRCGSRGTDDNPTSELGSEIVCAECEEEACDLDWLTFIVAIPAGIGGVLLGYALVDWWRARH